LPDAQVGNGGACDRGARSAGAELDCPLDLHACERAAEPAAKPVESVL
jgi:hypothetical protein